MSANRSAAPKKVWYVMNAGKEMIEREFRRFILS
jgi:hypothetical protein